MNIVDFAWTYGPLSIWFLVGAIFASAVMWMTCTIKILNTLRTTTTELSKVSNELGKDTGQLREGTNELHSELSALRTSTGQLREELGKLGEGQIILNKQMGLTRHSIDKFYQTLQRIYFWLPQFKEDK
jgi:regulator of replication initiation timing